MVDALRAAHRRVRTGGLVIDARPDASRAPRLVAGGRVRAHLRQSEDADRRDARADSAVDRAVRLGLFRPVERGIVWHTSHIGDLADLDAYVDDSARYAGYDGARRALAPFRSGPIAMRRAIKFALLDRL
jgi:hypothetical protein